MTFREDFPSRGRGAFLPLMGSGF